MLIMTALSNLIELNWITKRMMAGVMTGIEIAVSSASIAHPVIIK